jgi:hypothetical protein
MRPDDQPPATQCRLAFLDVSDDSEQEWPAELTGQAVTQQKMAFFLKVKQLLDGALVADADGAQRLAREVGEAIDLGMADVIAAVRKLGDPAGMAASTGPGGAAAITGSGSLALSSMRFVADGDVITAMESESVATLEDIGRLTARARRDGIARLSTMQVLALVLVWLLAIGLPVAQQALPPAAQIAVSNEYATLGVAIVLTSQIVQDRKR